MVEALGTIPILRADLGGYFPGLYRYRYLLSGVTAYLQTTCHKLVVIGFEVALRQCCVYIVCPYREREGKGCSIGLYIGKGMALCVLYGIYLFCAYAHILRDRGAWITHLSLDAPGRWFVRGCRGSRLLNRGLSLLVLAIAEVVDRATDEYQDNNDE